LFIDLIPFRETRDYIPAILRNAYWYHRLFPELTENLKHNAKTSELLWQALDHNQSQRIPSNTSH